MIAFFHDAPERVREFYHDVGAVMKELQLVFVGKTGCRTLLEQKALKLRDLRMRAHVLLNHLHIRRKLRLARLELCEYRGQEAAPEDRVDDDQLP